MIAAISLLTLDETRLWWNPKKKSQVIHDETIWLRFQTVTIIITCFQVYKDAASFANNNTRISISAGKLSSSSIYCGVVIWPSLLHPSHTVQTSTLTLSLLISIWQPKNGTSVVRGSTVEYVSATLSCSVLWFVRTRSVWNLS